MEEDFIQVFVTIDDKDTAKEIAESLVSKKLAACVQITSPIESTYTWKEEVERSEEWMLMIKSKVSLFDELEKEVKNLHPYETPEIVGHEIIIGNEDYLDWMKKNLK
ncbi:MAG: divalent-cation tolerance protein CutA [Thermoplasmatota archaeon]